MRWLLAAEQRYLYVGGEFTIVNYEPQNLAHNIAVYDRWNYSSMIRWWVDWLIQSRISQWIPRVIYT